MLAGMAGVNLGQEREERSSCGGRRAGDAVVGPALPGVLGSMPRPRRSLLARLAAEEGDAVAVASPTQLTGCAQRRDAVASSSLAQLPHSPKRGDSPSSLPRRPSLWPEAVGLGLAVPDAAWVAVSFRLTLALLCPRLVARQTRQQHHDPDVCLHGASSPARIRVVEFGLSYFGVSAKSMNLRLTPHPRLIRMATDNGASRRHTWGAWAKAGRTCMLTMGSLERCGHRVVAAVRPGVLWAAPLGTAPTRRSQSLSQPRRGPVRRAP